MIIIAFCLETATTLLLLENYFLKILANKGELQ